MMHIDRQVYLCIYIYVYIIHEHTWLSNVAVLDTDVLEGDANGDNARARVSPSCDIFSSGLIYIYIYMSLFIYVHRSRLKYLTYHPRPQNLFIRSFSIYMCVFLFHMCVSGLFPYFSKRVSFDVFCMSRAATRVTLMRYLLIRSHFIYIYMCFFSYLCTGLF